MEEERIKELEAQNEIYRHMLIRAMHRLKFLNDYDSREVVTFVKENIKL